MPDIVIPRNETRVIQFRLAGNLSHRFHRFHRILSHGTFTRQHDCRGTVEHRISYVGNFRSGRNRTGNHGLQHLCCGDADFAGLLASLDETLLNTWETFKIHFHPHVPTGNHDTVRQFEYFLEVLNALHVFDFADNLNLPSAVGIKEMTEITHILCFPDKGCRDIVYILFNAIQNIRLIHRTEILHIQANLRNINPLVVADSSPIVNGADDICICSFLYRHPNLTVIDENRITGFQFCRQHFICDGRNCIISFQVF